MPRYFAPLPEPEGPIVTVGLVSRMLRDKGVLEAVAAIRRLRTRGMRIELVLAGPTDPDNRGSLSEQEMASLAAEPGIEWLGRVADVREVWRARRDRSASVLLWRGRAKSPARGGGLRPAAGRDRQSPAAARWSGTVKRASWCRRATSTGSPRRSQRSPAIRAADRDGASRARLGRARIHRGDVARETVALYRSALQEAGVER